MVGLRHAAKKSRSLIFEKEMYRIVQGSDEAGFMAAKVMSMLFSKFVF